MRLLNVALVASLALSASAQAPPEFEVASIKPSAESGPGRLTAGIRIDGAQFNASFFSLKDYIGIAWGLKPWQVSGPEWLASQRFDIAAKLPSGAARKDVPAMLKALLTERFQLKVHPDSREFPVYGLSLAKGGHHLKPSADATATSENLAITGGGDSRGTSVNLGSGSSYTFAGDKFEGRKMTMPVFAEALARFVDRPVVDFTGLQGFWDLSLEVSPEDFRAMQIRSGINAGVVLPPQVVQMAESASGESLHTSLARAGLKLEPRKAPLEVVVVDHMEKTPAAN